MIDFFTRLRQIGEGGMLLRIGKIEWACTGGNRANEALAETQLRQVHGVLVETFGGVELKHGIGAQHVKRADFRHHVGGDVAHDTVKSILRFQRLLHELAEPFQQNARADGRLTHRGFSKGV